MKFEEKMLRMSIKFTKNFYYRAIVLVLSASLLIWIAGFIHAYFKVVFPENELPVFSDIEYLPASKIKIADYLNFNKEFVQKILQEELEEDSPNIDDFHGKIMKRINKKKVLFETISLDSSIDIENIFNQYLTGVNRKIDSLNNIITNSSYYPVSTLRTKQRLERKFDKIDQFKKSIIKSSFMPGIKFPENSNIVEFNFTYGNLNKIVKKDENKFILLGKPANPVIEKRFLIKRGYSEKDLTKYNFVKQGKILEREREKAENSFKRIRDAKEEAISVKISAERKKVRKDFYSRWFAIMFNGLVSFIMLLLLYQYFRILYRKGLQKKTTFEIYYATNMTSLIFRWIAIIVVFGGILTILYNFLSLLFTNDQWYPYEILKVLEFIGDILNPIIVFISVIISTWIMILISEFIFHISNLYQVSFEKSHKLDENKNQVKEGNM